MQNSIVESFFMSDHLDQRGFKEGDVIQIQPISGRKSKLAFRHKSLEFISEAYPSKSSSDWVKKLPSLSKEKFHIEFIREKTIGRQNANRERVLCRSLDNNPFEINGVLSFSAFLEKGDEIKIGNNKLNLRSKCADINDWAEDNLIPDQIATSDLLILIQGETGTGKTNLAKKIHEQSGRSGNLVHLNLSSYPSSLLESELFGHIKGAFTGANTDKKGAFESALNGTLFLDEIDSLTLEMQTKLLLFLDDKKFRPVGQVNEKRTNARIIIAAGKELKSLVSSGKMRKDFYFRLASGHVCHLEPLRKDDFLIERFCEKFALENKLTISQKLIDFYKTLPWPGNYRQIKNHLLKKKIYTHGKKLEFDQYDEGLILTSMDLLSIGEKEEKALTMKEMKVAYAVKIYMKHHRNFSQAARVLNISVKSLKDLVSDGL